MRFHRFNGTVIGPCLHHVLLSPSSGPAMALHDVCVPPLRHLAEVLGREHG